METFYSHIHGLLLLLVGMFLLFRRPSLVQGMLDNHRPIWKPFGKGGGSESVNRMVGNVIILLLGVITSIAGSLMLYSGVTGQDWPLHYAQWKDVWPF